ncbi:Hypothetical protein D9617_25g061170 [Elsinoe fawcettii]|nr:Hypothetical protein D9617_25g061170 [Elsinoe fawcettii]
MPKKHKPTYSNKSSSFYIHPSLGSSKTAAASSPPPPPATVNERLQQLRREQTSAEQTQSQIELAARTSQRSIPPSLGGILGVPESAPPAPKPGTRQRTRFRTPGPAPPRSWLAGGNIYHGSVARSARTFGDKKCLSRPRASRHLGFLEAVGETLIPQQSLLHHSLKALARNWQAVDDDGLWYLSEFPAHVRSALVSYISCFGPEEGISPRALAILLRNSDSIECLDLTALAGWTVSLKSVTSILTERSNQAHSDDEEPESWDADETTSAASLSELSPGVPLIITKLSLAQPPPTISWNDLLALTSKVPTLTHLSLAEWPFPTKTPNMINATTVVPGSTIAAAGSSMYSLLFGDLTEARALLRQFSKTTYCLKYLDLSGCEWTEALLPEPISVRSPGAFRPPRLSDNDEDWTDTPITVMTGPDWLGSWRRLTHLRMAQSTPPQSLAQIAEFEFAETHHSNREFNERSYIKQKLVDYLTQYYGHSQSTTPKPFKWSPRTRPRRSDATVSELEWEWRPIDARKNWCNACSRLIGSMEGVTSKCH